MESPNHSWTQWLKRSYSETPIEGPDAKRVKFSDVHDSLMAQFPSELISKQMASHAIQEAFPNTHKQHSGWKKITYIVGIQSPVQIHPSNPVDVCRLKINSSLREFTNWKQEFMSLKSRHHNQRHWFIRKSYHP